LTVSRPKTAVPRIYLNAYVPKLQVGGQVVTFLCEHRGYPVPSPALFNKIDRGSRRAVAAFAEQHEISVIRFAKGQRKIDVVRPYLDAARGPGVVAIGVAQEFQSVFSAHDRAAARPGPPQFSFAEATRGSASSTSMCSTTSSDPGSSRSARIFLTWPRSG
jgi:hypothetical protein